MPENVSKIRKRYRNGLYLLYHPILYLIYSPTLKKPDIEVKNKQFPKKLVNKAKNRSIVWKCQSVYACIPVSRGSARSASARRSTLPRKCSFLQRKKEKSSLNNWVLSPIPERAQDAWILQYLLCISSSQSWCFVFFRKFRLPSGLICTVAAVSAKGPWNHTW